jgi:hypothetical protein
MSVFEEAIAKYRVEVLNEAPGDQVPAASGAIPPPDPAAAVDPAADPEAAEPEGPSPEEVVDELEKASKKPWVDLAGVLGRAMEHKWTDEDLNRINNELPGGLTVRDFVDVRTSPRIKDKYDANLVSAAVSLFDKVDKIMNDNGIENIVPADER